MKQLLDDIREKIMGYESGSTRSNSLEELALEEAMNLSQDRLPNKKNIYIYFT
jgi:hypothetical protein